MSKARAGVLARLRGNVAAVTVEQLATEAGQHTNTVREHLEALVADGHASKAVASLAGTAGRAGRAGRGRPAWLYQAVTSAPGPVGYAALAAALASHLAAHSQNPSAEGEAAGRAWAMALPASEHPARSARTHVVKSLTQAGFGVQSNRTGTELTLTTCPIVEAARTNPDVVCAVHRGLVKELLTGSGLPEREVQLLPFAGPGFCTLLLPSDRSTNPSAEQRAEKSSDSAR